MVTGVLYLSLPFPLKTPKNDANGGRRKAWELMERTVGERKKSN